MYFYERSLKVHFDLNKERNGRLPGNTIDNITLNQKAIEGLCYRKGLLWNYRPGGKPGGLSLYRFYQGRRNLENTAVRAKKIIIYAKI